VFGGRLHRKLGGIGTAQDAVDVGGGLSVLLDDVGAVGHETASRDKEPEGVDRRQAVPGGKDDAQGAGEDGRGRRQKDDRAGPALGKRASDSKTRSMSAAVSMGLGSTSTASEEAVALAARTK